MKAGIRKIVVCALIGIALILSWLVLAPHLWIALDEGIFRFFNQFIDPQYPMWAKILALLNTKGFDFVMAGVMGTLLIPAITSCSRPDRRRYWASVILWMLFAFLVIHLLCKLTITYHRPSPTISIEGAKRLSKIVDIPHREVSSRCFPSNHGIILIIFSAFLFHFSRRWIAWTSVLLIILLTAPRIMVGAHWFSDTYMGALAFVLLTVPWFLVLPYTSKVIEAIQRRLDSFLDRKKAT